MNKITNIEYEQIEQGEHHEQGKQFVPERGVNPAVGVHHRVGDLFNNAVNRVP